MKLYLVDKSKLFKFILPEKIDGSFLFTFRDKKKKIDNIINVEEINGEWKLKSNGNINVVSNNGVLPEVSLKDYATIPITVGSNKNIKYIFCLPSNDTKVTNYSMSGVSSITIGSSDSDNINFKDGLTVEKQASIVLENGEYYLVPTNEAGSTYLNDEKITINERLRVGDIIFVNGLKIIWMRNFIVVNNPRGLVKIQGLIQYVDNNVLDNSKYTPVSEEENNLELYDEDDYFSHTPRLRTVFEEEEVVIEAPPPNQNPNNDLPFLLTIGTSLTFAASSMFMMYNAVLGLVNGTSSKMQAIPSIIFACLMLFSSLIMPRIVASFQKKKRIAREKLRQEKFGQYLAEKEEYIQRLLRKQAQIISENNITLQACRDEILSGSRNVWNREIKDNDFLSLRFGMGTYPSSVIVKAPQKKFSLDEDDLTNVVYALNNKYRTIDNIPVTLSLAKNNIVSCLCSASFKESFIDGLVLQLATYHSALDLKIVLFTSEDNATRWSYLKNLPHTWSNDHSIRFFSTSKDDSKVICSLLEKEFLGRLEALKNNNVQNSRNYDEKAPYTRFNTYYIILTDDYRLLKGSNFINEFLKVKANVGFSLLMFDESMRNLPQECETFVVLGEKECGILNKELRDSNLIKFKAEFDPTIDMKEIATKLSNIPVQSEEAASQLPSSLSFMDMYNVAKIEQLNILNRWKTNDPTTSLSAIIGVHKDGELFKLDLHEKYDGPHGLIAGSTGSGKSEFIITYILSMALNYHPYEVQFVLIDYKGGGLTGAFENRETGVHIPHLAGTITNLDISEMNRTLVSIESELKRRQAKFNEVRDSIGESTMDIYKYQRLYRQGVIKEPISHLFIISDEFAELKAQQPDFMDQLISTARIGRSLGVHLILATQKPSGVVNDQIWSNSKFKVCLKVQSKSDSMEMLKRPEAASIKEAGRFYLQVGYDEYFDIGQSGWSGAKYVPSDRIIKKNDDSVNFINSFGAVVKNVNDIVKSDENQKEYGDQLTNIVRFLHNLAEKEKIETKKMWLDSLPDVMYLNDLIKKYDVKPMAYNFNTVLGEYDAPRFQQQGVFSLDLSENTLINGMVGSGKENLIYTMLYSLILNHTPKEVNIYIADFGSETMTVFNKMPHVGDVLVSDESDKLMALHKMLEMEYDKRKKAFVDYSGSFVEYNNNNTEKYPLLLVVLNGFENFQETYSRQDDMFDSLFRDGPKYGISFIVSSSVSNAVRTKVAQNFPNKVMLQVSNLEDYRDYLGAPRGLFPARYFGRGLATVNDIILEVQTAYIAEKSTINNTIRNTAKYLKDAYKMTARKIPIMPDVVTMDYVSHELLDGLKTIPLGVEILSLEVYVYNFLLNKINLVSATDILQHRFFINALVGQMASCSNVKVKVIDVYDIFKKKYDGVEVYNKDFDGNVNMINTNLQTEKTSADTTVYVMVGVGAMKNKLSKPYADMFDNIFANVNGYEKSIFVFADDFVSLRNLQVEEWYRANVDDSNGIWLGEDFGEQLAVNANAFSVEQRRIMFPFIGYPVFKGSHMIVRYVTDGVEEE